MGGQQSQPRHAGASQHVNGGSGLTSSMRDFYQDSDEQDEQQQPCLPCFFMKDLSRRLSSGGGDAIGTPLPDTPLFRRKQREQVQQALRKDDPVFSSQYDGLEKELRCSSSSLLPPPGNQAAQEEEALVHEGPTCEAELYAKYQLMEVVGVGSTSTVHRCVHKVTQKEFACKVIDVAIIEERFQGMLAQFLQEVEALRKLSHPGIIRLYDVYITGEKIFIVMENMNGGELFDYVVQKGTLTEGEASRIVRKVTSALVHMHNNNICHRDLKPENLLLKSKPKGPDDEVIVKIIDFGLSKAMVEPVARTFLGTRGYLAPEMLQRRDYTKAVDTWALGVIVFVLVCGCLPFDDDSATVPSDDLVRAKFVLRFPRWAKNLSASAKDLLSHLLDVNPQTRYTAEQALQHPWVQGETAPKRNMLSSPGRIKQSPMIVGSARGGGRRYINNKATKNGGGGRKHAPSQARTPPTPQGPMIRKTSM